MTDKIKKGIQGEELALRFLEQRGFKVVERNYRFKRLEIDLIVRKDQWLIFVEVKTRSSVAYGHPEAFVDDHKAERIFQAAEAYIEGINWEGEIRFDIVSVLLKDPFPPEVFHWEDAFH